MQSPSVQPARPIPQPVQLTASQLGLMPHFSGGRVDGVMVGRIEAGSVYEKTGVRMGDIIRKVNGKTINTLQQGSLLQQVMLQGVAELEIVRNGQIQVIRSAKQ